MEKILFISGVLCFSIQGFSQQAEIIKLADLQHLMEEESPPVHIINFWATWCAPCVKELPFFEKITAEKQPGVQVTLVSLDLDLDPNPEKVYRFIARKNIQSKVVLLDETDPNAWIIKIDSQWSGALPATILINHQTGKRRFIGKALEEGELERFLEGLQ